MSVLPHCSYIDVLGFLWSMLLVCLAVFIYFTGAYMDHKHRGRFFRKSEPEPTEVVLNQLSEKLLSEKLQDAVNTSGTLLLRA